MAQRFGNNLKAIKVDVAAACKRGVTQGGGEDEGVMWRSSEQVGWRRQARCANCDRN